MFLAETVHLFQKLLLALRVGGQEVGGERESVGDDLVAGDKEDEGLGQGSGWVSPGRVCWAFGGRKDLTDDIKILHAYGGGRMAHILDHLEEISTPLREERRKHTFGP